MNILFKSICKIDNLGRIVLSAPIRKMLNISPNDQFNITVTDNKIILEPQSK